jgi:hypothetical protein
MLASSCLGYRQQFERHRWYFYLLIRRALKLLCMQCCADTVQHMLLCLSCFPAWRLALLHQAIQICLTAHLSGRSSTCTLQVMHVVHARTAKDIPLCSHLRDTLGNHVKQLHASVKHDIATVLHGCGAVLIHYCCTIIVMDSLLLCMHRACTVHIWYVHVRYVGL